jgi:hypothetical protein
MDAALITFFAVLLISMLIVRIATVMLKLTGISHDAARFQARSAFTGTGFTTSESESVVHHPVRRRIIMALMLVRNAGFVTLATTLILSFVGSESNTERAVRGLWLIGGLLMILVLTRIPALDRGFGRIIEWALRRFTSTRVADYESLLNLSGDYEVVEMLISSESWVADRTLEELALSDEGMLVLGIRHGSGRFEGAPGGSSYIAQGDTIVIYGTEVRLSDLRGRPPGAAGDEAHRLAVSRFENHIPPGPERRKSRRGGLFGRLFRSRR